MSLILNQNIWVGVVIIQPINDFSDEYMVPINSGSFKTPSLTPHTLPYSRLIFIYIFLDIFLVLEFWEFVKKQKTKVELQLSDKPIYTPWQPHWSRNCLLRYALPHNNPVVGLHGACVFSKAICPINPQYLLNGKSDGKKARNKRDGEFNFHYGMHYQI